MSMGQDQCSCASLCLQRVMQTWKLIVFSHLSRILRSKPQLV